MRAGNATRGSLLSELPAIFKAERVFGHAKCSRNLKLLTNLLNGVRAGFGSV